MNNRKTTEIVFALCLFTGHIYYTYIYFPIRNAWLKFKYRKESAEVRDKYINTKGDMWPHE